jgi:minor histocompatibility antigen H13
LALGPAVIYAGTKNWITNNIFGLSFSVVGIENLSLPNFKTGFILLWGLFFYDIFWVYGTDVMVTVAKSFDAPIKLIFPYKWEGDGEDPAPKFSMLGLGDIVIPGIFVALCLKYDIDRRLKNSKNVHEVKTNLFNWCFGGYILGIVVTYAVMVIFKHA